MDHDAIANAMDALPIPAGIGERKAAILDEERQLSLEQALIVTDSYRVHPDEPKIVQRALAFAACCERLQVRIRPGELIVGNRTAESRAGVVFPEAAVAWIDHEIESLPSREQDTFAVTPEQIRVFREEILPCWQGCTLEDAVYGALDEELLAMGPVVKLNQRDHAQGHIIPDLRTWLTEGPAGLEARIAGMTDDVRRAMGIALAGMRTLMRRYADLARHQDLTEIAATCEALADRPPLTFPEALQSLWFLLVGLHLESNASSFSPGRLDQVLLPFYAADLTAGRLDPAGALTLIEHFCLKCNEIVYLRNADSARYFAGFPIGFNVCIGGIDRDGVDATNELSYLFLRAQHDLGLPQPNLSARLHAGTPRRFLLACARVIGRGSGMPQVFADASVIPALVAAGLTEGDARDYGIVGCVELAGQGNFLGWSDAAMFNLVKALELALNDGVCLLSGDRLGPATGTLADHADFAAVEAAFATQLDHFVPLMLRGCALVDRVHAMAMPSPFLSSVVDGCVAAGIDVTAGGARYDHSGIQAIQVANVADTLAAIRTAIFTEHWCTGAELLAALRDDFASREDLRQRLINRIPKYGNDVPAVDALGARWAAAFADRLRRERNVRGGPYVMGLYTVSAHVPMGANVGASADGRRAREPLADGGLSPMVGRDRHGPTAVLRSVARIPARLAPNGSLLNLKFLPAFFADQTGLAAFTDFLRAFAGLGIHHVQFNVVDAVELRRAQERPAEYRHLAIRVAGYTAWFTELAGDLQDEIITRTAHGG